MANAKVVVMKARDLRIDPEVQRAEEPGHVDRLAREWTDVHAGVLIGSKRADGKVYVLDGFQRLTAVRDRLGRPDYQFNILVHTGLSKQEEARIFLAHNKGRKAVTPYATYRVALTAGDPVAVAVEEVVTGLGLRVGTNRSENTIACISTLQNIVGKTGREIPEQQVILRQTLDTYRSIWGGTGEPWKNEVVEGLAIFFQRYLGNPNFDQEALLRKMRGVTVTQVVNTAHALSLSGFSNRYATRVAEIVQQRYDSGRSKTRLLAVS